MCAVGTTLYSHKMGNVPLPSFFFKKSKNTKNKNNKPLSFVYHSVVCIISARSSSVSGVEQLKLVSQLQQNEPYFIFYCTSLTLSCTVIVACTT